MSAATRIVTHATKLVELGLPAIEAIEVACSRCSTTPAARDRARSLFLAILARAERSAA